MVVIILVIDLELMVIVMGIVRIVILGVVSARLVIVKLSSRSCYCH